MPYVQLGTNISIYFKVAYKYIIWQNFNNSDIASELSLSVPTTQKQ